MDEGSTAGNQQELAQLLNDARLRLRISIRAAAKLAGVPHATVQGWLNGRHLPTPALHANFVRLVEALGLGEVVDADWWIDNRFSRVAPQLREGNPPYLGLRSYDAQDLDLFFGRRRAVEELAAAVRSASGPGPRIVVLVGASGSGKSSLLGAGLAQAMQPGGTLDGRRLHPVPALALAALDDIDVTEDEVVVADQFEDLFQADELTRAAAVRTLQDLAATATVVIGLRADAFGQASLEPVLAAALSRPILLAPLTLDELREAITAPALSRNVVVEDELVTVLSNELVTGTATGIAPSVLPLVSTALLFTWAAGTGSRMTLADYLNVGGVGSAVERLAEEVFESLDPHQQQLTERLVQRLVTIESDSISTSSLPLGSLDEETRVVVDAFADARLLTLTRTSVRISHEALLRHWPRVTEWVENGREKMFVLQQLKRAAQLWLEEGRDPESLLPAKRLPLFQALVEDEQADRTLITAEEREFVAASAEHYANVLENERRTNARLRLRGRLATVAAALSVALAVIASSLYTQSQAAELAATTAEAAAQSRQVALAARQERDTDPNLERRLALVADALSTTVEARSILGDATSVYAPVRWAGTGPGVMAVSPDRQIVARGDGAGRVTLWRGDALLTTAGSTFEVDPGGSPLTAVALAGAGPRTLLAVTGEAGATLWDVTTDPTRLYSLDGPEWSSTAFNPAGTLVAFGNREGRVLVVDLNSTPATLDEVHLPTDASGGRAPARTLLFSNDGTTLFAGGEERAIVRWHVAASRLTRLAPIRYHVVRPALSLALSPSGDELVAGLMSRRILRWRLRGDSVKPLPEIGGFLGNVNDVTFAPDGGRLLAAGDDHGTYTFDPATGARISRLNGPAAVDAVETVLGGRVATVDGDGDLRVWPTQDPLLRTDGSTGYCFSTDKVGHWLALATAFDGIVLWDTSNDGFRRVPAPRVALASAEGQKEGVASGVVVDPKGRFLVAGTDAGNVVSWPLTDAGAGTASVVPAVPGQYVGFLAMNPSGTLVAAVPPNDGSEVALLSADADGRLAKVGAIPTRNPQSASFSPDGTLVAVPRSPSALEIWSVVDPGRPQLVASVALRSQPIIVTFAPQQPLLAVGEISGVVTVTDLSTPAVPREVSRYTDSSSEIYGLNWSPDGAWLLGSGGDEGVYQWDATRPGSAAVAFYSGRLGRTNDVTFVHEGRQFVATGDNGDVRSWIAGRDDARRYLCATQGSPLSDKERAEHLRGIPPLDPCRGVA